MAFVEIGYTTLNILSTKYEVGKAINKNFADGRDTHLSQFAAVITPGIAIS